MDFYALFGRLGEDCSTQKACILEQVGEGCSIEKRACILRPKCGFLYLFWGCRGFCKVEGFSRF